MCLHAFICLLIAYCFICVMCFIQKNSCMFNFTKTDAHICFTEYVMSVYCIKCIICDVTLNSLQKSVILQYQQNFNNHLFSVGPSTEHL